MDFEFGLDKSTYVEYILFIKEALKDDKLFESFKSNKDYNRILEHVDPYVGLSYYEQIKGKIDSETLSACLENDKIGNPKVYLYEHELPKISPTTLRYIKFAIDVVDKFKNNFTGPIKVVEIGAGYGGFCKIFLDIAKSRNVEVSKYIMLDLEDPAKLINKYISLVKLGQNTEIIAGTLKELETDAGSADLLIAFYSYSELCAETRKLYKSIVDSSKNGFMCWNSNATNFEIETELGKNVYFEEEVPLTGTNNKIVFY